MSRQLQNVVMSAVILGMLISGSLAFAGDIFNTFGAGSITSSEEFAALEESQNRLNSSTSNYVTSAESQTGQIAQDIEKDVTFVSSVAESFSNIYTASEGLIAAVSNIAANVEGFPAWFVGGFATLLLTAVVFGIFFNYR